MALILYILFLLVAVVGRVILQYRITGDHGLRPATTNASIQNKSSSILFVITFLSTFSLSILEALNIIEAQINFGLAGLITGTLLCALGIITTIISQYQMGSEWRIGVDEREKTTLITHGLYSYVRNPIYSGVILFGLGLLFFIPHMYMLLGLCAGYLSIELHVRNTEEPYLRRLHGTIYETYAKKVNRYFPKTLTNKRALTRRSKRIF